MKGGLTLKILELVKTAGYGSIDMVRGIISAGHGASYRKMGRYIAETDTEGDIKNALATAKENYLERKKYYNLISKLKRDGLIKEREQGGKTKLELTDMGENKLTKLKLKDGRKLPAMDYVPSNHKSKIIISFDIPEKYKEKRDWLRSVLKNLDLKMIHKSVWLGSVALPQELLDDIRELKLARFVEIFGVTKIGSLE